MRYLHGKRDCNNKDFQGVRRALVPEVMAAALSDTGCFRDTYLL